MFSPTDLHKQRNPSQNKFREDFPPGSFTKSFQISGEENGDKGSVKNLKEFSILKAVDLEEENKLSSKKDSKYSLSSDEKNEISGSQLSGTSSTSSDL